MLDVAAVARRMLEVRPRSRKTLSGLLNLSQRDATNLAVLIAAFHDLGKFSASFQKKATGPFWPFARSRELPFASSEHVSATSTPMRRARSNTR
jgi:CRISPR/Cas system-associated endonuclease Cas3-HD